MTDALTAVDVAYLAIALLAMVVLSLSSTCHAERAPTPPASLSQPKRLVGW